MFCCLEQYMTDQTILRDAILTSVPGDGSTIGNQSLLEQLRSQFPSLAEDMFWAVRDALIDEGLLAKGRGRGGAVRRTDGAEQAPSSLAEPARYPADCSRTGTMDIRAVPFRMCGQESGQCQLHSD